MILSEPRKLDSLFDDSVTAEYSYADLSRPDCRARMEGAEIILDFPYDPNIVDDCRRISRMHWDKPAGVWRAELSRWNAKDVYFLLKRVGFVFDMNVHARLSGIAESE